MCYILQLDILNKFCPLYNLKILAGEYLTAELCYVHNLSIIKVFVSAFIATRKHILSLLER